MVNGFDPEHAPELSARAREHIGRRDRFLGPGYRLFYSKPGEIVRAQGTHMFDADGNDYLDVYNNVACVGHCHPRVIEAVHRQMSTVNTNTRYMQDPILRYSEDLLSTLPTELGHVMYTCTGSEANDLAMRVVRRATGRTGVIVTANAYHGLTSDVAAFSPSLGTGVPLGPAVRTIPAPDAARTDGDMAEALARNIREAVADLERHGFQLAAFIADSIFSSDGIFSHPAGFLGSIIEEVHAAGGLYIADEVQPGFGRTGSHWWGFQRHSIVPDIVTMGKPMGNGIPVAAAVFKPELLAEFGRKARYFNTFGGNSVSIAAAQAVLDVIRDERLLENAATVGAAMRQGIAEITEKCEQVAEIRGDGLFTGVEIVTDAQTMTPDGEAGLRIVNYLRDRHILISASGVTGSVLKIRPPMPFALNDCDRLLTNLKDAVAAELH